MKEIIKVIQRKKQFKKKSIRYQNAKSENLLSYRFSERKNSIQNFNQSNKIILPNLKIKRRYLVMKILMEK